VANQKSNNPFMTSGGSGTQPETYKILRPFEEFILKPRGWRIKNIHGNALTGTLPDRLIHHADYGFKFVEYKVRHGNTVSMSKNQKRDWVVGGDLFNGLNFWVIAAEDLRGPQNSSLREILYNKLFQPYNSQWLVNSSLHRKLF